MKRSFRDISMVFLLSLIVFSISFPEFHIFPSVCLYEQYFNQGYTSAAIAANQFYNGGIQLWDRYDQMPYAYYTLTIGFYKIFEVLTTIVYACLSPLMWDQAKAFHHIYSIVFVCTNLFLKVVGSYLLLRRFVTVKGVLYAAVIFLSVFFSRQLVCDGSYFPSFYPLAIHLALNVFEKAALRDLFLFIMYMAVLISYSMIYGLYLYCNLHFLILSAGIWCVWENRKDGKVILANIIKEGKAQWPIFLLLTLIGILMVAPNLYMIIHSLKDFYFNEQSTRVHDMWSRNSYLFKMVPQGEPVKNYLWLSSRFLEHHEGYLCPFIGCGVMFFSLAGLIFSSDNRKYIFFISILLLLALASTHSGILADSLKSNIFVWAAQWITIWTNPIKFVLRDFHEYATHMLPFLFMPLAVMGIEAVYVTYKEGLPLRRAILFLLTIYVYGGICLGHLQDENFIYVLGMMALMTMFIIFSIAGDKKSKQIKTILLVAFFVIDMTCSYIYTRGRFSDRGYLAKTQTVVGDPREGVVGLKYTNPQILPFPQFFTSNVYSLQYNYYIEHGYLNYPGKLFHYTNISKNFIEFDPYLYPRPKAFSSLTKDYVSYKLILLSGPLIYEVGYAVNDTKKDFLKLHYDGMDSDVVLIRNGQNLDLGKQIPAKIQPRQGPKYKFNVFSGQFNRVKTYESEGLQLYAIPLPSQCPSYEASTFLTMDKLLLGLSAEVAPGRFYDLSPVQGQIVSPMTFDVNNIRKGWIVAGFYKNQILGRYSFSCAQPLVGVTDIWKNQEDNLGFDYNALTKGWVMMMSPYDPKWQITMDGHLIKYYLANHAFISFPIAQGKHKILMQYWPHTALRGLLMLSMVLSNIILISIIYLAMAAI